VGKGIHEGREGAGVWGFTTKSAARTASGPPYAHPMHLERKGLERPTAGTAAFRWKKNSKRVYKNGRETARAKTGTISLSRGRRERGCTGVNSISEGERRLGKKGKVKMRNFRNTPLVTQACLLPEYKNNPHQTLLREEAKKG